MTHHRAWQLTVNYSTSKHAFFILSVLCPDCVCFPLDILGSAAFYITSCMRVWVSLSIQSPQISLPPLSRCSLHQRWTRKSAAPQIHTHQSRGERHVNSLWGWPDSRLLPRLLYLGLISHHVALAFSRRLLLLYWIFCLFVVAMPHLQAFRRWEPSSRRLAAFPWVIRPLWRTSKRPIRTARTRGHAS